jgi:hypothetical protein
MSTTVTVKNPFLSRKFGFGYSTTPVGSSDPLGIKAPSKPDYQGTIRRVKIEIDGDRLLESLKSGGTFFNSAWFYDGKRILCVDGWDQPVPFVGWLEYADADLLVSGSRPNNVTLVLAD